VTLKYIIFDLDDTLYPRDTGLMHEVGRRIQMWLCDYLGLKWEEAIVRRREYFHRYGTTLGGLIAEHGMGAHDYLVFVHDVPVEEYLDPNPALAAMLDVVPLRKAIYTNATSEYGWRVLRALGVADRFEQVIGIEEVGLRNKSNRDAYERTLELLDAQGCECIMVEDTAHNLRPARELGLTTVLVDTDGAMARPSARAEDSPRSDLVTVPDEHVDFVIGNVLEVGQVVRHLLCRATH
jgi:putative hydrolase of the HAD superfamily